MSRTFSIATAISACALAFTGVAHAQTTTAPITREQAIAIAQKQVPGAQVVKTELDHDDGRSYYEVKLVDAQKVRHEVKINAADGSVREHESKLGNHDHDRDDDNRRDGRKGSDDSRHERREHSDRGNKQGS